jgi:radical SAM protein with 4Fe4S-binding SPASM domain
VDCPAWPVLNLGDLTTEWLAETGGGRYPFSCTFEITERCNLSCMHCFINQPAGGQQASSREMTAPQIGTILDQIAEAGCLYLLLTGGEALLRPDFQEILRHAKEKGLLVTLFTNGTLLTPEMADFLAEWRPWWIEVTLYGATQRTFEGVTRVPGSHARCMKGIDLALDRGLRVGLKAMAIDANHHELEAMRAFARGLAVPFRYDAVLWPRFDGGQAPVAHRLPAEEIAALDRDDPERRQAWLDLDQRFAAINARREYVYTCGAGHHGFHIDSTGHLSMCMMARHPSYDLLQGSFEEGWSSFLGSLRAQKRTLDTACRTCSIGVLCSQCPGWSQAAHGDDETPADFVCELGHLRAARLRPAVS